MLTLSQTALNDLAVNFIRPVLATIPGVQLPNAYGGAARQVQIELDQNALRAHSLTFGPFGLRVAP
jgi:multidrug efflux pump subunit AcrB